MNMILFQFFILKNMHKTRMPLHDAKVIVSVSIISFILNGAWEYFQCPLFVHLRLEATTTAMLIAILGDVLLNWISVLPSAYLNCNLLWFLEKWKRNDLVLLTCVNVVLSILVERFGLYFKRWTYTPSNPMLWGLGISIFPFLQLVLLVPLNLWLSRVFISGSTSEREKRDRHLKEVTRQ